MCVYEIRSYADISSFAWRFVAIKQIVDKIFQKYFNIYIPTLI